MSIFLASHLCSVIYIKMVQIKVKKNKTNKQPSKTNRGGNMEGTEDKLALVGQTPLLTYTENKSANYAFSGEGTGGIGGPQYQLSGPLPLLSTLPLLNHVHREGFGSSWKHNP